MPPIFALPARGAQVDNRRLVCMIITGLLEVDSPPVLRVPGFSWRQVATVGGEAGRLGGWMAKGKKKSRSLEPRRLTKSLSQPALLGSRLLGLKMSHPPHNIESPCVCSVLGRHPDSVSQAQCMKAGRKHYTRYSCFQTHIRLAVSFLCRVRTGHVDSQFSTGLRAVALGMSASTV